MPFTPMALSDADVIRRYRLIELLAELDMSLFRPSALLEDIRRITRSPDLDAVLCAKCGSPMYGAACSRHCSSTDPCNGSGGHVPVPTNGTQVVLPQPLHDLWDLDSE